jgi:hypothetical protein
LASSTFQVEENKTKQRKKTIEKKKCKEGRELSFKLSFCLLTFGSCFYPPISALLFQMLSLDIFFFSSRRKEKKNHREEKKCREGKEFSFKLSLCPLTFGSHFCLHVFALLFQHFLLTSFSFQAKEKKRKEKKKP